MYTKTPPVASTLKDLRRLRREVESLHAQKPVAMVHCRSYLTALIGLEMKRKFGIPFLFDMRGFWADERVDGKIWNLKNPVYRVVYLYFKNKEREFLTESDAVVSLTLAGKEEIKQWFLEKPSYGGGHNHYNFDAAEALAEKTAVIPCAADLVHFDRERISPSRITWLAAVHGIDLGYKYLGYVGSLGTWYMTKEMVKCYAALRSKMPDLRFLLLTRDDVSSFRKLAESSGIPQSHIVHVAAERRDVPALMSMMTASLFFILPAFSKKASSPTKQGELMAMGVPVICNDGVGDPAFQMR